MGGLLSFINTPDGWEYLMSKDWLTDVQTASKQYKGVAGKGCGQNNKINSRMGFISNFSLVFSVSQVLYHEELLQGVAYGSVPRSPLI